MNVGFVHQTARGTRPAIPAVAAYPHAIHFNASPDTFVVRWIHHQGSDARPGDIDALGSKLGRQFFPVETRVARAKKRRESSAGEHHVGVCRIYRNAPDMVGVEGRLDMLEIRAAILAAIDAVIGAGINDPGVARMDRQAEDRPAALIAFPELSSSPPPTAVGAAPKAHSQGSNTNSEILSHGLLRLLWQKQNPPPDLRESPNRQIGRA